jgi:hypothetical protein
VAKFVATDYVVTVGGTDLSSALNSVELSVETDDIETTTFGNGFRTRIGGLKQASITLNFLQDFGAGAVDATIFPLLGTLSTVVIKPTSSAVSATNPSYTSVCLVNAYSPFASSVGDIATLSVTWPVSGTVVRGTA